MADVPKIAVDELRQRLERGENFTFVDVRNPRAWAESDVMLPQAIRVPLDDFEEYLPQIPKTNNVVTYCT